MEIHTLSVYFIFQLTLVKRQCSDILGTLRWYCGDYLRSIYEKSRVVTISYG
jgi:hypothetical protein